MYAARKCLKNQLLSISGCNNGLQVRVLPGSPFSYKDLPHFQTSRVFSYCGDFCGDSYQKSVSLVSRQRSPRRYARNGLMTGFVEGKATQERWGSHAAIPRLGGRVGGNRKWQRAKGQISETSSGRLDRLRSQNTCSMARNLSPAIPIGKSLVPLCEAAEVLRLNPRTGCVCEEAS